MDLLTSLYIFCLVASELMGSKVFTIVHIGSFALNASVAIFLLPVIFSINDVITEVMGKERTASIIRSGFVVLVALIVFSFLSIALPPSMRFSAQEPAYDMIFGKSIRIAVASLISFAASEFLDVAVFVRLRKKLKGGLWLRNNASNIVSQLADTVLFITLAFYAMDRGVADNFSFLAGLILPYWLLKCGMSVIETPFVYLGVRWLNSKT